MEYRFRNLRVDKKIDKEDTVSLIANAFDSRDDFLENSAPIPVPPFIDTTSFSSPALWRGAYTGARWSKEFSDTSNLEVQANYLFQEIDAAIISPRYYFYEIDAQHRFRLTESNDLIYGFSYRRFYDSTTGSAAEDIIPAQRSMDRYNWFVQDEITILPQTVHLILGSKFEQNVSTGFEYMPNARVIYTPNTKNSIWASVSRAVAPPSLVFEDVVFPAAAFPQPGLPNGVVQISGSRNVKSEDLLAYEVGYRTEISENVSADVACFYNRYDDILSIEPGVPFVGMPNRRPEIAVIIPAFFANELSAETIGGEFTVEWRPTSWWRLTPSYSYIHINALMGSSTDTGNRDLIEGATPEHQANLRSSIDITRDIDIDLVGRYVDAITSGGIPDYLQLDARLGWRPMAGLELSVVGQNLLESAHPEFTGNLFGRPPIDIQRGVYGKVEWQF